MLRLEHDLELLAVEREMVQPLVRGEIRQRIDRDVDPSRDQALLQLRCGRVDDLQLDAGMARAHVRDQIEQIGRRDGAHQAEAQRRLLADGRIPAPRALPPRRGKDLLQIGL